MDASHRHSKHPTILALSEDHDLIELLLKNCGPPWKVTVSAGFSCLYLRFNGDCRVVVMDDEKLLEADRGWLLNKIQNRMPQAFVIYIASQHTTEVERLARTHGAGYYLSKPIDTERLTHVITALQRHDPA
jgi:DNA-binding NtrC family response regulator